MEKEKQNDFGVLWVKFVLQGVYLAGRMVALRNLFCKGCILYFVRAEAMVIVCNLFCKGVFGRENGHILDMFIYSVSNADISKKCKSRSFCIIFFPRFLEPENY